MSEAIRKRIDGLLAKNAEFSKTFPGTFRMPEVRQGREEADDRVTICTYRTSEWTNVWLRVDALTAL